MKTESDIYQKSGNNRKTREIRIPEPKEKNSAPREACQLNEHLNNIRKCPKYPGRTNPGSSEAT